MMDDKIRTQVIKYYQSGKGSIQAIARAFGLSVEQVLEAICEQKAAGVTVQGDMIDQSELGPGAQMNYGRHYKVPFDLG